MVESAKLFFEEFCKSYSIKYEDDFKNTFGHKYYHTYRVYSWMQILVSDLGLSFQERDLALTIALFHDIGRFIQFKKSHVYDDLKAHFDHAKESCALLKKSDWFSQNAISKDEEEIILFAILNHNKLEIAKGTKMEIKMAKLIRDADKLAILEEVYHENFVLDSVSPCVIQSFLKFHLIDVSLCKTSLDELLTYVAFLFDFNYEVSIKQVQLHHLLEPYLMTFQRFDKKIEEVIEKAIVKYIERRNVLC